MELDSSFRVYTRAILTLATTIHRSRELRNLFVDLSQILDIWKQNGWNVQDLESFLNSYTQCALEMDILRCIIEFCRIFFHFVFFREVELKSAWERYMKVITKCLLTMF